MSYLAVDPGLSTGWALLGDSGWLARCGRGQIFPACRFAIIELPQVYRPSGSPAPPDDIVTLAVRVGQYKERLEARGAKVQLVKPASWKGQVKKDVHHQRIFAKLTQIERTAARECLKGVTEKQAEDVWDAIGLAKWAWGHDRFGA